MISGQIRQSSSIPCTAVEPFHRGWLLICLTGVLAAGMEEPGPAGVVGGVPGLLGDRDEDDHRDCHDASERR